MHPEGGDDRYKVIMILLCRAAEPYWSLGWDFEVPTHDLVVSNTRASRFYHLKLEEGELNDAYSHSMLNFRLFMSDFRLLLRLGFNFALSHSLRVKEQVVQSIFLQEHKPINGYSKSCGVHVPCSNKQRACIYKAQKLVRETLKPR